MRGARQARAAQSVVFQPAGADSGSACIPLAHREYAMQSRTSAARHADRGRLAAPPLARS